MPRSISNQRRQYFRLGDQRRSLKKRASFSTASYPPSRRSNVTQCSVLSADGLRQNCRSRTLPPGQLRRQGARLHDSGAVRHQGQPEGLFDFDQVHIPGAPIGDCCGRRNDRRFGAILSVAQGDRQRRHKQHRSHHPLRGHKPSIIPRAQIHVHLSSWACVGAASSISNRQRRMTRALVLPATDVAQWSLS